MKRLYLTAAIAIGLTTNASNISFGQGGGAGGGQAGASAAGAGQSAAGAGQMGQGQQVRGGQVGRGNAGAAASNQFVPPQLPTPSGVPRNLELYGRNPWFNNPNIQQQLGANPQQLNGLSQAYQSAYTQYQRQLANANSQGANAGAGTNNGMGTNADPSNRARGNARGSASGAANRDNQRSPSDLNIRSNSAGQNAGTNPGGNPSSGTQVNNANNANNANNSNNAQGSTKGAGGDSAGPIRRPIVGFNADGTSMSGNASAAANSGNATNSADANTANSASQASYTTDGNASQTAGVASGAPPGSRSPAGQPRMLEAQRAFDAFFDNQLDSLVTDPQQRTRFRQLRSQFRGFDTLSDPLVQQQLNLTSQQVLQMTRAREQWLEQMDQLANLPPEQRNVALQRFNLLRQRYADQINQTLTTPEQRRAWVQMFGEPYDFGFDAYFGSDPSQGGQTQGLGTPTNPSGLEVGARAGQSTSSISGAGGTERTPGAGSSIGTSANPTPGTNIGTSENPHPGTNIGTSTGGNTGTNIGTSGSDR